MNWCGSTGGLGEAGVNDAGSRIIMSDERRKCVVCKLPFDDADSLLCRACRKKAKRQTRRLDKEYDELTGMIWVKKGS